MKFKVLFVFAVVLVLGIAFALMWFRNHGRKIQQYDRMIAEEVQEAVETHFSTLQPADPISQRYGKFIELVGSGYERGTLFGSTPKIRLQRTARFEKASIRCPIEVFNRGPAKLHLRLQPSAEWMSKNPEHKLVIRGNELILVGPNSTGSTELSIGATHPRFYWDVFDLAEAKSLDAEVEGIVDDMVASVADKNPAESSVVQDWYNSQRRSEPVEQFLMRSLEHPNPEIGVEAIRLLGTATNGRRVSLSEATHLFDPWESAVAVSEDGRQFAVLTHHSLDWYNIATGELQGRSSIFLPKGRIEVVPLMMQFFKGKVIVVGMSNNGSTRRRPSADNPLWVRAFSMDVNK